MGKNFGDRSLWELLFDPAKYKGGTVTVKEVKVLTIGTPYEPPFMSRRLWILIEDEKQNVLPVKLIYPEVDFISKLYADSTLSKDTITITGKFKIREGVPYIDAKRLINHRFKIKTTDEIYHHDFGRR